MSTSFPLPPAPAATPSVARTLRRPGVLLATGERADAHAWPGDGDDDGPRAQDHRVVKIFRGPDPARSAYATAASLGAVQHPHILPLLGLVQLSAGGVGILLPRLSTSTAADWLAARRVITAGESVTLLVPILLALLHVDRRRLDARVEIRLPIGLGDVLFDARGAPVVTGVRLERACAPGNPAAPAAPAAPVAPAAPAAPVAIGAASLTHPANRFVTDDAGGAASAVGIPGGRGQPSGVGLSGAVGSPGAVGVPGAVADETPKTGDHCGVARDLVSEVLSATVGGSTSARATLLALCEQSASIDELLEVLCELDEAAALEAPLGGPVSGRHGPLPDAASTTTPAVLSPSAPDAPPHSVLDGFVPGLAHARAVAGRALDATSPLAGGLKGLREVRPRVWATAGVLAASAIVGAIVVGGPDDGNASAAASAAPASADTGRARTSADTAAASASAAAGAARARERSPVDGSPDPNKSEAASGSAPSTRPTGQNAADAETPTVTGEAAGEDTAAVLAGDDADGATRTLLGLRADCLAALDAECLGGVDEADSPLLADDVAAVGDPALLADVAIDLRISAVVNRLGGAVVYRARGPDGETSTVLATRSPSGWRLRGIS